MAWRNIEMPIPTGTLSDFSYCEMTNYDTNYQNSLPSGIAFNESWNYTVSSAQTLSSIYVFGDANNGLYRNGEWNSYSLYWHRKVNGTADNRQLATNFPAWDRFGSWEKVSFIACVNDETHKGAICIVQYNYNGNSGNCSYRFRTSPQNNTEYLYNALIEAQPITYTWQSVAGVYGKSGHILFSHVLDDSVLTGSDISDIDGSDLWLVGATCLDRLLDNCPTGTEVTAFYSGDFNHLTVTKGELSLYATIKIYAEGHIVEADLTRPGTTRGWDSGFIGFIIDEENHVAKLVYLKEQGNALLQPTGIYDMIVPSQSDSDMDTVWTFLHGHTDNEEENEDVNTEDPGTDPEYQSSIPVQGLTLPSYGAYDTGFTSQYRVTAAELKALAAFLWSSSFTDVVEKFFNDPREIIIGLCIMPVIPDTGASKEIKAGGIRSGVYGLPLTNQYTLDTYGTAKVKKVKGNFLDYAPYTKVNAHIPFCGEHSLNVNDVMGKKLTLKYIFDFISGSCVAEIDVNGEPRYFFGGSCGIQVPTSSEDFGRMYSALLSAGATLGSTLATIATGGLAAPLAIGSGINMLANGMNMSPDIQYASGSGSINGMIGCKTAFLTIERPKEKIVGEQHKYLGRPSYMTKTLSDCTGYTKCMTVHLDNVPCTATERAEIERLLLNGVRIQPGSETPEYTPTTATDHGVIFLKCVSDMDVIGKSWDGEDIETIEGKLLYEQSFLKPVFVFEGNFKDYNYCYIPEFDRFYYITEQIAKTGDIMEMHMQCDVLQSWKTEILSNQAVIERSENKANNNAYFADDMYWTQVNKEVETVPFLDGAGNQLTFEIPEDNFILTIAGGD